MRITWGVAGACLVSAIAAMAPTQRWSQRLPRWLPLTSLWIACALFLLRGLGNPIQTALIASGVVEFAPLAGPLAQEWKQWLLMDLVLFSPWFVLGAVLFGATAWTARRRGDPSGPLPGYLRASGVKSRRVK
jgi:hypothetical protein